MHDPAVLGAINLGAGTTDGRTFGAIQEPKLDGGAIREPTHDAIERIDLPDQMALAKATDGGIAGHHPDRLGILGQQRCARAHAGGSSGGFTARMPPTNDDHIKASHAAPQSDRTRIESVSRETYHLPIQNRLKISPSTSSGPTSPMMLARARAAIRNSSAATSGGITGWIRPRAAHASRIANW